MEGIRTLKKDWILTQEAFDLFLNALDPDREHSAEKYELLRLKLIKYFEWNDSLFPEDLADETVNRISRKMQDGEVIQNLNAYIFGAARHLASESRKGQARERNAFARLAEHASSLASAVDHSRLECCESCLQNLPESDRYLIVGYYARQKRNKIEDHQRIARELGLSLNSLRIRVHRIKAKLAKCIAEREADRPST